MTTSCKVELLRGLHDFTPSTGNTFRLALYAAGVDINAETTVYSTTDEVTGTGYTAGGATLTTVMPTSAGITAFTDFADLTFSTVTITTVAGLIYNSTNGNRAVCVLDFGRSLVRIAANLVIQFPTADSETAIVRIA